MDVVVRCWKDEENTHFATTTKNRFRRADERIVIPMTAQAIDLDAGDIPGGRAAARENPEFDDKLGNIRRGMDAMHRVIEDHVDVVDAMERPGLGSVSFYWGETGDSANDFKGGSGVAHIIAKRNAENGNGRKTAYRMVEVIARGETVRRWGPEDAERVEIKHEGHAAILSLYRFGDRETWLLTGWEEVRENASDDPGEAYDPPGPTDAGPTRFRPGVGAEASESNEENDEESSTRPNPGGACVVSGRWNENDELNGVEIRFSGAPPKDVRDRLKEAGFRYHPTEHFWWNQATPENLSLARELAGAGGDGQLDAPASGDGQAGEPPEAPSRSGLDTKKSFYFFDYEFGKRAARRHSTFDRIDAARDDILKTGADIVYEGATAVHGDGRLPHRRQAPVSHRFFLKATDSEAEAVQKIANGVIQVQWDESFEAERYNVYRAQTSGGPYPQVASYLTGTSYEDTEVSTSEIYYYVVTALSTAYTESVQSAEASNA